MAALTLHEESESQSATQNDASRTLITNFTYTLRDPRFKIEKPYKLTFDSGGQIPRTNVTHKNYNQIHVRDFRQWGSKISFENNGFTVLNVDEKLFPEDYDDIEKVEDIYYPQIQSTLQHHFGAKRVEILEHQLRKRHADFPISTGEDYEYLQPTALVHVDFTLSSALELSRRRLQVDNDAYSRVQCVNVWKPLRGPLTDWPLGLCDTETVDMDDYLVTDIVRRDHFLENQAVHFNPRHQWYYLSCQQPTEIVVFRQTDTNPLCAKGVPHTGFENAESTPNEPPRESIETRVLLYY